VGRRAVITIDGPAGAGKSTVARLLARSLGYIYLDSGALYRAVAWQASLLGLDLGGSQALSRFLADFQPVVTADARGFHLLINGQEVTQELRAAWVSQAASKVAVLPVVRQWVKERLRHLAQNGGVVAEGRDQGSVVFPQARYKFYLDAALATRAARRRQDWQGAGDPPPLEEIMAEVAARDLQDETRADGPLTVPPGAIRIDTTDLSIDEVVRQCLDRITASSEPGQLAPKPSKPV
jgi:cytidylate kinase